jgi:hypothetical protein
MYWFVASLSLSLSLSQSDPGVAAASLKVAGEGQYLIANVYEQSPEYKKCVAPTGTAHWFVVVVTVLYCYIACRMLN